MVSLRGGLLGLSGVGLCLLVLKALGIADISWRLALSPLIAMTGLFLARLAFPPRDDLHGNRWENRTPPR